MSTFIAPTTFQADLGLEISLDGDAVSVAFDARDDLCTAPGHVALGVLATAADCAGGMRALTTVDPNWTATMSLSVHRVAPFASPRLLVRPVVRHRRRGGLVIDVTITDALGTVLAVARGSFADRIMDGRSGIDTALDGAMPLDTDRVVSPLVLPVDIDADGVATLSLHDGLRNTANALVGGATAVLLDTTAVAFAGGVATDMEVHYLGPARSGPVVARPALVGRSKPALVAVTVVDAGADDRLVAEAFIRTCG